MRMWRWRGSISSQSWQSGTWTWSIWRVPCRTTCCEDKVLLKPSLFSFHPHLPLLQLFQFAELIFLALQCLWLVVHWLFISFFNFFQRSWNIFKPVSCGDIWGWFPWDLGEAGIIFSRTQFLIPGPWKTLSSLFTRPVSEIIRMFAKINALSFWGVWGTFDNVVFVGFLGMLNI